MSNNLQRLMWVKPWYTQAAAAFRPEQAALLKATELKGWAGPVYLYFDRLRLELLISTET